MQPSKTIFHIAPVSGKRRLVLGARSDDR